MQQHNMVFSVGHLMHMAQSGSLALPEFQRDFVWHPDNVLKLLESLTNGWPIGSLLFLEGPQQFGYRSLTGGPVVNPSSVRFLILDGQQRITALFQALNDTGDYTFFVDFEKNEEDPKIEWLERRAYNHGSNASRFLVRELFETKLFLERVGRLPLRIASRVSDWRDSHFGQLASDGYVISATILGRDVTLDALSSIFEHVNTSGVALDTFDLMTASTFPSNFHLREEWDYALERYPVLERMSIDGIDILRLLAIWQREIDIMGSNRPSAKQVKGITRRDILNIAPSTVKAQWHRAVDAFSRTAELLRSRLGAGDGSTIPTRSILVPMSYWVDRGGATEDIVPWYWRSIFGGAYEGAALEQTIRDTDSIGRNGRPNDNGVPTKNEIAALLARPAGRQKIARLGLQSLLLSLGARDVITRDQLTSPVQYFSMPTFLAEKRLIRPTQTTVAEIAFFVRSAGEGRTMTPGGSDWWGYRQLAEAGFVLSSQGLPPSLEACGDPNECLFARTEFIHQQLEAGR